MTMREMFPELELIDDGDPYLEALTDLDDEVDHYRFEMENEQAARITERQRAALSSAILDRWWAMPSPRIH